MLNIFCLKENPIILIKILYLISSIFLLFPYFLSGADGFPFVGVAIFLSTAFFSVITGRAMILYYAFSLGFFVFLAVDYVILDELASIDFDYASAIKLSVLSFWALSVSAYVFSSSNAVFQPAGGVLVRNVNIFYFFLYSLFLLFLVFGGSLAVATMQYGRQFVALNSEIGSVGRGLQVVLSVVIPFYASVLMNRAGCTRRQWISCVCIVAVVALVLFLQGNRYPILLSLAPFFLNNFFALRNPRLKSALAVFVFLVVGVLVSNYVVSYREEVSGSSFYDSSRYAFGIFKTEGIVESTKSMIKYFDANEYKFGSSTLAVLLFWIPSSLWEGKPTQLGYWLPRAYDASISQTHSAAFGFYGVAYSDFGLSGAVLFSVISGILLSVGSGFYSRHRARKDGVAYFSCFLVAISFFAPRDVSTPLFVFCGFLIFYFVYRVFFKVSR